MVTEVRIHDEDHVNWASNTSIGHINIDNMVNLKWEWYITMDSSRIIKFKIDTGVEVSVLPASYLTRNHDLTKGSLVVYCIMVCRL